MPSYMIFSATCSICDFEVNINLGLPKFGQFCELNLESVGF